MEQFQALDRQVQTEMKHILSQEPPLFFTSSFHQVRISLLYFLELSYPILIRCFVVNGA